MGCLRNWVSMLVGMGLRNAIIVGPVKSRLSMYFLNVHRTIPRDNFNDLKQVLLSNVFEDFVHRSIFDKTVFCLGEK